MAATPESLTDWQQRLVAALDTAAHLPVDTRGATPFEVVGEYGPGITLRHYPPIGASRKPPVLVVYSLVNRPFILDLTRQRSLIHALNQAGHPVYLVDWGYPRGADRFLTLDDYIGEFLATIAADLGEREQRAADVIGVCQGGVFALALAALFPERVRRLVTLVTPTDFHTPHDTLSRMAQHIDFEQATAALGNVSARWLNPVFVALKPYRLLSQRYVDLPELAERPEALHDFMRMERWMYDSPDQAAAAFAQFGRELYQRNGLVERTFQLDGQVVRLDAIHHPVLNVFAELDHLVPPDAARALGAHVGSSAYREVGFPGGHLGVFISRRAHRELVPAITEWLNPD